MRLLRFFRTFSWRKLFFYSEAVGVLLAWGLGLLVALDREGEPETPTASDSLAAVIQP